MRRRRRPNRTPPSRRARVVARLRPVRPAGPPRRPPRRARSARRIGRPSLASVVGGVARRRPRWSSRSPVLVSGVVVVPSRRTGVVASGRPALLRDLAPVEVDQQLAARHRRHGHARRRGGHQAPLDRALRSHRRPCSESHSRTQNRSVKPAPPECGPTIGVGVTVMRVALFASAVFVRRSADETRGRRLVPREEEHRARHAERQRDAEGHVRDERVGVAVVRRRRRRVLVEGALVAQRHDPEHRPDARRDDREAARDVGGHLAARLGRRRGQDGGGGGGGGDGHGRRRRRGRRLEVEVGRHGLRARRTRRRSSSASAGARSRSASRRATRARARRPSASARSAGDRRPRRSPRAGSTRCAPCRGSP